MNKLPILKGFNISQKEKEDALKENKALVLAINMNKVCDLRCLFCFQDAGIAEKGQLTLEQYKDIINQAIDQGVKYLYICGAGEPLLDKIFFDRKNKGFPILEYAQEKGLYSIIFTNATQITKEVAERLFHFDLSVMCKLNSYNKEIQDKLIGKKGAAKQIYKGIQNLMDAGFNKSHPTRLSIDTLICKDTAEEIPCIIDWAVKNNIYPVIEAVLLKGRAIENREILILSEDSEENTKMENEIREKYKSKYPMGKSFYGEGHCDLDQYCISVNFEGSVAECVGGRNDLIVGNVKEKPLKELWNHKQLKELRNKRFMGCNGKCPGRLYCEKDLS